MLGEFRDFIARGNVLDLAVGLVAGTAFGALVTSLVSNVVTPLIGLAFALFGGEPDFSNWRLLAQVDDRWVAYSGSASADGGVLVGRFLNSIITFLATMLGLFFFVVKPTNAFVARLQRTEPTADHGLRECTDCLSQVPSAARRCMHCTTELDPIVQTPAMP